MRRKTLAGPIVCWATLVAHAMAGATELPLQIVVHSGEQARSDVPVELELPGFEPPASGAHLVEFTSAGERETPCQFVVPADASNGAENLPAPVALVWRLSGQTPANVSRRFELRAGPPSDVAGLSISNSGEAVTIFDRNMLLLHYNGARVEPPSGVDPNYGRGAMIHPMLSPAGVLVTDAFPPDHLHQNGVWLAYPKTRFRGQEVNFWELGSGQGTVRCQGPPGAMVGPLFAEIVAAHEHVIQSAGPPTVVLNERWRVRIWGRENSDPATPYVVDLESVQSCATDDALEVLQYHYGGMALRGARDWRGERCAFLTSNGKTRADGNHAAVRWCDMAGESSGKTAGVALLSHPDNLRHPESVRIHPEMPYFCMTAAVAGDWKIEPGAPRRFRYRLVVHDGPADANLLDRLWSDFAIPPRATMEKSVD